MAFPLAAAAIGAIGSIGSSVLGNSGTRSNMRLQAQLNKEQMKYQDELNRSYQKMLWNNQYSAQMSGMKNAGMNPAFDGASPSMQASNSVGSGASGPSAPVPDLAGGAISAMNAEKDMTLKDKQADMIDAQIEKTKSETKINNAEAKIREYDSSPDMLELRGKGVDATVKRTYAQADVAKQEVRKVSNEADKVFEEIGLTKELKNKAQAETAKTYTAILTDLQGLSESEQRIALMIAEEDLKKEEKNTEKAKQYDLYQSGKEHASGAKLKDQLVNESKQKVNESKQAVTESKARTAGHNIANRAAKWRQDVIEMSGSKAEQAGQLGAKRIIGIFNPLEGAAEMFAGK